MKLFEKLKKATGVETKMDESTKAEFSRDWSLFSVEPKAVAFPETADDVGELVDFVNENKPDNPDLSLTGRSAGTDMTGGPLTESIVVSFTEKFNSVKDISPDHADVEPGVYYRDFEKKILPKHLTMPTYPASKSIAAIGGMVMNNCGGEKTLRYGQMRDYTNSVSVVLRDGNEYTFGPIDFATLEEKKAQDDLEGEMYRQVDELIEDNWDLLQAAEPKTSKNSSGYCLWRVKDKETKTFDMSHLFVGSQGTLGIMTEANVKLQPEKDHEGLVAVFFDDWELLPEIVNAVLPTDPESLEVFDKETLKLGLRFMPEVAKEAGQNLLSFLWRFLPEAWIGAKMGGLPGLVLLVELAEETEDELEEKIQATEKALGDFDVYSRTVQDQTERKKYWVLRRQSFSLLRSHAKGKSAAPFVEDLCIDPEYVPEFLPRARDLLETHEINVNIAGHAGNGNFHIIPLMNLSDESRKEKIPEVAEKFYDLVLEYDGTITAEHNDGIVRTPFVEKMFGADVYHLFEETKEIFDPNNIFNPGKKVDGTIDYMTDHIADSEDHTS